MVFWEQIPRWARARGVVAERHLWLRCISVGLCLAWLMVSTACGSECSARAKSHLCADETHFLECGGGEGWEHDSEVACPESSPLCLDVGGRSSCQSQDEVDCVTSDPALRGQALRTADLDADGLADLVFLSGGVLSQALAAPGGGFAAPVGLFSGVDSFELADLTQDGVVDLLVSSSDQLTLILGEGDGSFTADSARPLFGAPCWIVGVADVDADGVSDVIVREATDRLSLLLSAGDFAVEPLDAVPSTRTSQVLAADLDADGAVELLIQSTGDEISIFSREADAWQQTESVRGQLVAAADLDGDGRTDLVLNAASASEPVPELVTIALRQPEGGFKRNGAAIDGKAALAADLNADGRLDLLLVRGDNRQLVRLDGQGDGRFREATPLAIVGPGDGARALASGGETIVVFPGPGAQISQIKAACLARP